LHLVQTNGSDEIEHLYEVPSRGERACVTGEASKEVVDHLSIVLAVADGFEPFMDADFSGLIHW
jgi:hypothetical protein